MFCGKHSEELKGGTTLELEGGRKWLPREQFVAGPDNAKNQSRKKQFKRAFTITVKEQGSDSTRDVTVDRDLIDTIVGLQTGSLEKVESAPQRVDMSDGKVQDALE